MSISLTATNLSSTMEITVVYPAYNEEDSLTSTVEKSLVALRRLFTEFELLIVVDCPSDNTPAIAEKLGLENEEVRVIVNEKNLGQGKSLVKAFKQAKGEWVTHNGVDYPFDMEDTEHIKPLFADYDLIVTMRLERPGYTFYRKVLSWGNLFLLNTLFGLKFTDYNFVQFYRGSMLKQLKLECDSTAFVYPSLIIQAHDLGFRLTGRDTVYHPRLAGEATAGRFKVIYSSFRDMMKFWWNRPSRSRRQQLRAQLHSSQGEESSA
jgi:glycosyltransferase involved in cell wall biosynthesis